jgi:hypothetical protein
MTREQFKEYCLRSLGKGAIKINVTDDQLEDRVAEGIQMWQEVHLDGFVETYFKHEITADDITNKYIDVPEDIIRVEKILPIGSGAGSGMHGMFNIEYQLHLNDIFDLSFAGGMSSFVQTKQYLGLLDSVLNGIDHIAYSRYQAKLYLHINWAVDVKVGSYIVVKAYRAVDPDAVSDCYNDRWLKRYVIALIQQQWGQNLSLYGGVELLGGITMDGETMRGNAETRIEALENELYERFSEPPMGSIG